ncbi:hypothetical protein Cgig2_008084 [Carnegiea gigantea]|uniref:Uncharacterized protein n=1 Tax=Carnegiea gigantea TaxID=171969 RepID=A0A9Q1L063_9CARY|nr:hypothetical protein Cgig2_008084 [Carnegiea gigantea]
MAASTSTGFPCQKIQLICHNTTNNNNYYMMMRNSAPSLLPMPTAITTVGSISPTSLISRVLISRANRHKNKWMIVKAANSKSTETSSSDKQQKEGEQEYEEYEVVLEKPYGLKFVKGRDGGTYIDAIAPGLSADKTGMFTAGDKVLATSAVFGDDVWPAAGAERNAGFISNRVREIQLQNYRRKMEQTERREKELREGLELYRSGKYEEAREKFESVLGSKPTPEEASVASYNVACCYAKLNQVQAGLSALEDALEAGYEDFKRIRTDPDLENLRTSDEFEKLLNRFDESFINENAINAIKSLFGIFNKK